MKIMEYRISSLISDKKYRPFVGVVPDDMIGTYKILSASRLSTGIEVVELEYKEGFNSFSEISNIIISASDLHNRYELLVEGNGIFINDIWKNDKWFPTY